METTYTNRTATKPEARPGAFLLTSMRITTEHGYDKLTIWSGGACAGTLILEAGNAQPIVERLLGGDTGDWIEQVTNDHFKEG